MNSRWILIYFIKEFSHKYDRENTVLTLFNNIQNCTNNEEKSLQEKETKELLKHLRRSSQIVKIVQLI